MMRVKLLGFTNVVLATLLNVSVCSNENNYVEDYGNIKSSMVYLGSVDGKGFFAEKEPARTWFEAREACAESHMGLASINSTGQAKLLEEQRNTPEFTGWFWTAGRDSQRVSQFVWEGNNITVSNPGVPFRFRDDLEVQSCLAYDGIEGTIVVDLCTNPRKTLCEIYHGK